MKTWIRITDRIRGSIVFEGEGESEPANRGGIRLIFQNEGEEGHWLLGSQGALLDNRAQLHTRALIRPGKDSRMEVFSEYGEMEMPLEQVRYELEQDRAEIAYTLEGQQFAFQAEFAFCENALERSD